MLKVRAQRMRAVEVGRGRFGQAIVGESHYQDALRRAKDDAPIAVGEAPTAAFILAREPDNLHDANAIAVLTERGDVVHSAPGGTCSTSASIDAIGSLRTSNRTSR